MKVEILASDYIPEEDFLLHGLHVGALHPAHPGHRVVDTEVLDDGGDDHSRAPRAASAMHKAVATLQFNTMRLKKLRSAKETCLRQVVRQVEDVVHQVS